MNYGEDVQNYGVDNSPMEKEHENYLQNQDPNVSSSTLGIGIDKLTNNPNFNKKEENLNKKLNEIINEKAGAETMTKLTKFTYLINKILFGTSIISFLFDRFDVITLFAVCAVFFVEINLTPVKYLYKIILLFILSIIIDVIVFFDIIRYIASGPDYQTGSAGATTTKLGLLFVLINLVLKLGEIIGLWSHALSNKNPNIGAIPNNMNENIYGEQQEGQEGNYYADPQGFQGGY